MRIVGGDMAAIVVLVVIAVMVVVRVVEIYSWDVLAFRDLFIVQMCITV